MKKTLISLTLILTLATAGAAAWYYTRPAQAAPNPIPTAQAERTDLRVAIKSTGRVVSNRDVDIKCKASGAVEKLPYDVSDPVKAGDLLIQVDSIEAQRQLAQARARLAASEARLAQSKQNLKVAEQNLATARLRAEAGLLSSQAREKDAAARFARAKQLLESKLASQEEYDAAATTLAAATADLKTAQAAIEDLKTQELSLELRRKDILLAESDVASDKIAMDLADQRLTDTTVLAPIDGVVSSRSVQIGTIISSGVTNVGGGTTAMVLSDLSRMWVYASVDESDIGKLTLDPAQSLRPTRERPATAPATNPGNAATAPAERRWSRRPDGPAPTATAPSMAIRDNIPVVITVDAYRDLTFQGVVRRVATKGVNTSNVVTFEVRIEITDPKMRLLRPEMTANVEIITAERQNALTVPYNAVSINRNGATVTLQQPDGTTAQRDVKTGLTDGAAIEILDGLAEGDTVQVPLGGGESRWRGGGSRMRGPMGMGGGRR